MDMGYSDTEYAPAMIQTRMSVVRLPFRFENFHIFFERQCENTFNISAAVHADGDKGKVRNNFRSNNTLGGIAA